MPTYVYKCDKCGEVFEAFQWMTDPKLEKHNQVHGECDGGVRRLIQAAALRFVGSGFYVNDYSRKDSK